MTPSPIQIELTNEQFTLLSELSSRNHTSQQEVLTAVLRQFELTWPQTKNGAAEGDPQRSFAERLAGKGLLGCLEGGPPDLSANPDYMEGFGKLSRRRFCSIPDCWWQCSDGKINIMIYAIAKPDKLPERSLRPGLS